MISKSIYVKILFDFWSPIQQHNTPPTLFSLIYFDTISYLLQEIDSHSTAHNILKFNLVSSNMLYDKAGSNYASFDAC
jgi:hypothetical protein